MTSQPSSIYDLPTPALVLDWPTAQRNINKAAEFVQNKQIRLRPHFKNHKRAPLARKQLDAGGCVGMTAATVVEAMSLVDGGIEDVLIANQIVGPAEISRFIKLADQAKMRVAIDDFENARVIAQAAGSRGIEIGVLIEVDIGMGRCGVTSGQAAVELAGQISSLAGIRFDGIQAHEGHAIGIIDTVERESAATASMQKALNVRKQLG